MIEDAFSPDHISALRDEIDALEAELNPAGQEQAVLHERAAAARGATSPLEPPPNLRTRSGALISNISEAEAITFTSALVTKSALAREFCGCEVFQRIVHDILNVPDTSGASTTKPSTRNPALAASSFSTNANCRFGAALRAWIALRAGGVSH